MTSDVLPPRTRAPGSRAPRSRAALRGLVVGAVLAVALLVLRAVSATWGADALPDRIRDFVTLSVSVVIESLPFVFLGILISVVVRFWVPDHVIHRIMPRNPALRRVVISLVGVLLPVCECGNVPLARGFMMKGFSVPEAMTFLLAAPILNPVTIVTTYQAFGWNDGILIGRIAGGFVIANLVGWLFSRHPRPELLLTPAFEEACRVGDDDGHGHGRAGQLTKLRRGVVAFADETSTMLPALIVGSAIAGAIQVGLSRDVLTALGGNPIWSVLALMILAFVIAICSNVDAFFILAFGSTFLPGGVVAFLVFGAMVDVKMITLLRTTFTTGALVRLVAVVALASLALGFGVNLLA
ncbi:permease [Herbiconiux sp. CPCC 205716]|uniref:Permease n=1 Tax=Herbiconiux gentiana TaxID=2970912 RepID=A0ABT2GG24_9MICO|nr:permease [Herbiconiux gentiana]MCS5715188.1 permease [Herbiconiux gentiana]